MPILDIQKRARELGRIRIGQVVPTTNGKTRPEKLDRFRLTSHSRPLLEKVAELYGGTVVEWAPQGGGAKAWEVVTNSKRLPIMVPPQPITQWYEYWTAGGCKHRCDGHTNVLTDELCDPDDYGHQEALKQPTTRLNVVLRDVEGIGVWRLETHGWNAAVELPDAAEFLAAAGGYVNGWVSLEPRTSKAEVPDRENGGTKIQTRHFHVPIIEIDVTPAELMAGRGRVATPMIEGPVPPAAIEAPKQTEAAAPAAPAGVSIPTPEQITAADQPLLAKIVTYLEGHGQADHPATAAAKARLAELTPAGPQPDGEGVYDAEVVEQPASEPDPDIVWQQILKAGGDRGMSLGDLEDDVKGFLSISSAEASGEELAIYLAELLKRDAA
jgi:recombination directionality factor gp3-like protein